MSESRYAAFVPSFTTLTPGTTVSLNPTERLNFVWTPAQASTLNATDPGKSGQVLTIMILPSGVTNYALTLGTNFSNANIYNSGNVSGAAGANVLTFVSNGITWTPIGAGGGGATGMVTKMVTFTENATNTIHTGSVAIPAGAWLHNIQVTSQALWTGGTAVMKVGDSVDDDGYFIGVDLKATDLLVGEVLDTSPSTSWGGKEGAYLVAATAQRGPVATNFGKYYAAGSIIKGIVTVGTPATTVGRTFMMVTYSVGEVIAAVSTGP